MQETHSNGSTTDTIELVELQEGQHRLYINAENNIITSLVFSFFPYVDTLVYRYNTVDTLGDRNFTSRNLNGKGVFSYTFKQGIGLTSVSFFDGCTCSDGFYGYHSLLGQTITSVNNKQEQSWNYRLNQNYPNPFNPTTTILFYVPYHSFASLKIFDCVGREVRTLVAKELSAGNYSQQWIAVNIPSSVYFFQLQTGSFSETKKLVLLR